MVSKETHWGVISIKGIQICFLKKKSEIAILKLELSPLLVGTQVNIDHFFSGPYFSLFSLIFSSGQYFSENTFHYFPFLSSPADLSEK